MFTAALFIIAKTWKQYKYPLTDEWFKKMWCVCVCVYIYIYIYIYISVTGREQNNAICINMDGTRDSHTKMKSERERQIPYDITYMCNLKCGTNEPIYRAETDSQT